MKIEQLIVQYLYLHKKVTLEKVGTFHLSEQISLQDPGTQPIALPENSIQFELNTKAAQDEGLIAFIVEKTRKFKPLAISDLESFTILGKQFLNLGKPFVIKELGILLKNQNGEYEFTQTQNIAAKQEPEPVVTDNTLKEIVAQSDTDLDFTTPSAPADNKKWVMPAIILAVIIGVLAIVFTKFSQTKSDTEAIEEVKTTPSPAAPESKPAEPVQQTAPVAAAQDSPVINNQKDTTTPPTAQTTPAPTPAPAATTPSTPSPAPAPAVKMSTYKVVVREYADQESAQKGYNALTKFAFGKDLIMYNKDSAHYRLAVKVTSAMKDIPRVKDSVKALFGKNAIIDMGN